MGRRPVAEAEGSAGELGLGRESDFCLGEGVENVGSLE